VFYYNARQLTIDLMNGTGRALAGRQGRGQVPAGLDRAGRRLIHKHVRPRSTAAAARAGSQSQSSATRDRKHHTAATHTLQVSGYKFLQRVRIARNANRCNS